VPNDILNLNRKLVGLEQTKSEVTLIFEDSSCRPSRVASFQSGVDQGGGSGQSVFRLSVDGSQTEKDSLAEREGFELSVPVIKLLDDVSLSRNWTH